MTHAIRNWIDRLSTKALPAMALTRTRVPQLLNSPNSNNADLQRIISRDPGFSLSIYRAFSALPHPPKEPISNLAHAIALLGIEPMTRASNQLPALNDLLKGETRAALYACYSRAGHAAWYALNWGQQLRLNNPDEIAISALLLELGEMMLWAYAEQEMSQIIALEKRGMHRSTAEQTILGFELNELSAQLADRWMLPPLLVDALKPAGAFQVRSLAVMLASALAGASTKDWHSEQTLDLIELAAELLGQSPDQGRADFHSLAAGAARNLTGLPVPLSAYALLQPIVVPPVEIKRPIKTASTIVEQEDREKLDSDTIPIASTQQEKTPPQINKVAANSNSSPLQSRLMRIFHDIRESTGVDRVMFALLTPDRTQLRAKFIVGADKDSPLRQFQHPMGEHHLFTLIMKKPQDIWLNRENQKKITPLISEMGRIALDSRGFYMSSLFINNRPLGILYADRSDHKYLDKQGFSQFKSLAQRLSNELTQKK
ncbi:HDOD domain-containing protein [Sedimenticola selenatireducens]|uniref:HDOD domain-containing protein n=1 Tax=Sedimenticola selenatireducens TaxID=191960 RepID=A0A557SDR5_9GAMM|nr:HDOD domain-containing protein [Sedimenticola selenatireducens]TVO75546.1 HDOD domain-containing protein [Sedimenticola selenatireducens]TVT65452.1 MAG: HDOD domain-containing protein [Sedimenticola selenatireducens]